MLQQVRRFGPPIATAALVGWCCWSQVRESEPLLANMQKAELPEFQKDVLFPEIGEAIQGDPFLRPESDWQQPVITAPGSLVPEAPLEPVFDPRSVLSSFRLHATMVGTDYPVALINGRVYSEGERIALEGLPDRQCWLQRVKTDRVILEIENKEFEIIYSHTSSTEQQLTEEPNEALTTPGQLDLTGDSANREDAYSRLLRLLKSVVPNVGADLKSLADQCPLPSPTPNEIDNPINNSGDTPGS